MLALAHASPSVKPQALQKRKRIEIQYLEEFVVALVSDRYYAYGRAVKSNAEKSQVL